MVSDAVWIALFAGLTTIITPVLVLIVKRLTDVHKLVNSTAEAAAKEIADLKADSLELKATIRALLAIKQNPPQGPTS